MKCLVVTVVLWSAVASLTWATEWAAQDPSELTERTYEWKEDFAKAATLIPQDWATFSKAATLIPKDWATFSKAATLITKDWATFSEEATLRDQDEFSYQVAQLVSNATISNEKLEAVSRVLYDLEQVFNARWPGSRVFAFGSHVYGLVMMTSDIDCTLLLPHHADMASAQDDASVVLRRHPQLFADLYPITTERIPVITFKHAPTQFQVDLTFDNLAGIQLSNMLRYLLHLNERIYKLAFVVKRWAIARQLTDHSKHQVISNYGVTLMVIFYLQQRNLMPSIAALQVNADPFFDNEWNMGFCEIEYDIQKYVPLDVLIGDFFKYYADFDYDKYIVCPYAGYPVDKRAFADINKVPNEFGLYVHNVKANNSQPLSLENTFVLQDVFFHNLNVAKSVDTQPNSIFVRQFQIAARQFRTNNTDFLDNLS